MHLQSMMVELGVNKQVLVYHMDWMIEILGGFSYTQIRIKDHESYVIVTKILQMKNPANRWKKWCQRDCKCQVSAGQDEAEARYHIFTLD